MGRECRRTVPWTSVTQQTIIYLPSLVRSRQLQFGFSLSIQSGPISSAVKLQGHRSFITSRELFTRSYAWYLCWRAGRVVSICMDVMLTG